METTTATQDPLSNWKMRDRALVNLARLLVGYFQRERDENLSLHDKEKASVQADEARWASDNQHIWREIIEVRTVNELWEIADDADNAGFYLNDQDKDWQAEVWFAIAETLRKAAGEA